MSFPHKTGSRTAPSTVFDRSKDPRIQQYLVEARGLSVALGHDSVGSEYIAMWLSARIAEAQSTSHDKRIENCFTEMLSTLDSIYPPRSPAQGA